MWNSSIPLFALVEKLANTLCMHHHQSLILIHRSLKTIVHCLKSSNVISGLGSNHVGQGGGGGLPPDRISHLPPFLSVHGLSSQMHLL